MARRSHLFPCRTQKLSSLAPMVVDLRSARVGRCQAIKLFRSSSVVELSAVNRSVVGSTYLRSHGSLVKRLRHRPFTAVTRVRVRRSHHYWRISSAGRASALQAEGRRFEPVILHHLYVGG